MSQIEIRRADTRRVRRAFVTFPWRVYARDPLWVPPLVSDRRRAMDPQRGSFFERGEVEFFVAWQGRRPVGTVCAAQDVELNDLTNRHECTLGFFDCIDNDDVATALFDRVRMWAVDRRLDAVVGPFNLDRENGYGVLVEGRDRPPVLMCGHTPPYYASFFDRYGFVPLRGDNLAYAVELAETPALRRLSRLADRIRARGRLTVRAADLERWDEEVDRVYGLLQRALAHLPDYVPWRRSEVQELLQPFVKFVDPELVLFAEADGQTVGWFPGIPNLYEVLQHANGLRYPWDYVRLWWHSRTQPECLSIKSVLVLPEYWNTGVSVLLFDEMVQRARAKGFVWLDLSLTSEDNPYTPTLATRLGATLYKRYRVYRLDLTG